jgi:TonB family protein
MKLRWKVSIWASVTLLITFFIIAIAQTQKKQDRIEIVSKPISRPKIEVDSQPIFLKGNELQASAVVRFLPKYPPDVKTDRQSGIVIVSVKVNKEGTAREVRPLTGHPALRKAAAEALRNWRWEPNLVKGVAQEVEGSIRFDFDTNGVVSINISDDPGVVDPRPIYRAERLKKIEADLAELRAAPSPTLYAKVAHGYAETDRIQEAIEFYKEGVNRYPDEIVLYMALAVLYLDSGKVETQPEQTKEEVLEILKKGTQIKVDPDSPAQTKQLFSGLLLYSGFVYHKAHRYVEAKEVLERALDLDPSEDIRGTLYGALGMTYSELGDKDSAMAMSQKIAERGDQNTAIQLLGELYKKLWESGDKKSAAEVLQFMEKVCLIKAPKPKP